MQRRLGPLAFIVLAACGPTSPIAKGPSQAVACAAAHDMNKDCDGDGFTPAQGDCDDSDPTVYPGAPELCDGKDHNCNGIRDDICDDDHDGYAILPGGNFPGGDCNDNEPLVNPGAFEAPMNMIDDDCDGNIDNAYPACAIAGTTPTDFAASIDLCNWNDPAAVKAGRGQWIADAAINADSDPASRGIRDHYGMYVPRLDPKAAANTGAGSFVLFSTGIAADEKDPNWVIQLPGTAFHNDDPNPFPQNSKNACYSGPDELNVHDYIEFKLTLHVPTNAKSFSFDFNFFSAEYPEFVGSQYNDKFLVLLDSQAFGQGNISFDPNQNPINVNSAFFQVCDSAQVCMGMMQNTCSQNANELDGTGYEMTAPPPHDTHRVGGATGWLTTTSPVKPGETATLRFILFDEGDHLFDSAVLIDNFRWHLNPAKAVTVPS